MLKTDTCLQQCHCGDGGVMPLVRSLQGLGGQGMSQEPAACEDAAEGWGRPGTGPGAAGGDPAPTA